MKTIRIRVIILTSWLFLFYIIGSQVDPISVRNSSIGLVFVMMIGVIFLPQMLRVPLWAIILVPIAILLGIKLWSGAFRINLAMPLAALEICAIAITSILSRWVSMALFEFENAVVNITLGPREKLVDFALSGQGLIYREVRRARNHQRPLALISIGVDETSIEPDTEKMVVDIQRSMMKQYKLQGLSKMLCDELEDCVVIVQDTDHYLAVLPETMPEELTIVVDRLRQKARDQVGIGIKIGMATVPNDGYTFDGLVERATREMENDLDPQPYVVLEPNPIEGRVNEPPIES